MKHLIYSICILTTILMIIGCGTTEEIPAAAETPAPAQEEPKAPEVQPDEDEVIQLDEVIEEEDDAEYIRSTNNLSDGEFVSKSEFAEDKSAILQIIGELSEVMENEDYDAWVTYISPSSLAYWSNIVYLKKAQTKLPNQKIKLRTAEDYFKYIFIPSRQRSKVDEIRYISKTNIKAVQVKSEDSTIVYYYFVKEDGKWLVQLPRI